MEGRQEVQGGMASMEELLEGDVLGGTEDTTAQDVGFALVAVPMGGWGHMEGGATQVEGCIAAVIDDTACLLACKGCVAGVAGCSFQQELPWT